VALYAGSTDHSSGRLDSPEARDDSMINQHSLHHPNYVAVWGWLILLALLSVLIGALPLSYGMTLLLVFEIAVIKSLLVVMYFMHLRFESLLIYVLLIIPLLFFAILVMVLFPDIAFYSGSAIR
jgi:cytochrome c oxidase subunit 4